MAAFLDLASPFYTYSMFACGIPFVDLLGTRTDWECMLGMWQYLAATITKDIAWYQKYSNAWNSYFTIVTDQLTDIVKQFDKPDPSFWEKMFYTKECGSGHQTEAFGWFTDLLFGAVNGPRYVGNFPSQIATINYTMDGSSKKLTAYYGLLGSQLVEGCLKPDFGHVIFREV